MLNTLRWLLWLLWAIVIVTYVPPVQTGTFSTERIQQTVPAGLLFFASIAYPAFQKFIKDNILFGFNLKFKSALIHFNV